MASSRYLAENVVDAVFDDDFGLSDEDNSEDGEDDYIYGYLGGSFFTAVEPDNGELQQDEELAANEVESVEIGEDQVEPSAVNEENVIDEQLPVIHEDEVSAAALSSPEITATTELSDDVEATFDEVQAPVTDEGEVSRVADPSTTGEDEPSCSEANDTVSNRLMARYIKRDKL